MNNAQMIQNLDDLKPSIERLPFDQIGSGGRIFWNPNVHTKFVEKDLVKRKVHPEVILAHEMWHAYDSLRGLLDRRFISSEEIEFNPVSEVRAVYFENLFREERGYQYRKFYSSNPDDSKSTRDLLNDLGKPLFFPAPCIKWIEP